jgi:adenine-specific DNA-methyltransferase
MSAAETALIQDIPETEPTLIAEIKRQIEMGNDPLGDQFCALFSAEERRPKGATYTPAAIIDAMLEWAGDRTQPSRIVDPGVGSARFLVAAGRLFPNAELIGVEIDPLAALLARAHLATAGMADRSRVMLRDYRQIDLPVISGQTLFLGNPPYVRHHQIEPVWKQWLTETARRFGHEASQLAGLHVHFFLATAQHARAGDAGLLITAAEWLDVNYGRLVRDLLMGVLGVSDIQVIEPSASPFPGTQATAVITGFEVGSRPERIGLRRVSTIAELGRLDSDHHVPRARLETEPRWSPLTRAGVERREGFVELGELCRVHRGQVTGANRVWITEGNEHHLPDAVLFSTVTKARELFAAEGVLDDSRHLKRVIDLPVDLSVFENAERRRIEAFLTFARNQSADSGFIASHRRAWWSVGLRDPAPILATYMARRPPVFVRNLADARHINIAHGLYPRMALDERQLTALAGFLSTSVSVHDGRTYSGGLTKFEPREMERLLVPTPDLLSQIELP